MADDVKRQNTTSRPPKHHFLVKIGDMEVPFSEVSGLDHDVNLLDYRQSSKSVFSVIKMPGVKKYGNVILKKGTFKSEKPFRDWQNQVKMNLTKREPVIIQLLDETGAATMVWTLANAFPVKITGADLNSDDNEVSVETLELVHEGLTIANR